MKNAHRRTKLCKDDYIELNATFKLNGTNKLLRFVLTSQVKIYTLRSSCQIIGCHSEVRIMIERINCTCIFRGFCNSCRSKLQQASAMQRVFLKKKFMSIKL